MMSEPAVRSPVPGALLARKLASAPIAPRAAATPRRVCNAAVGARRAVRLARTERRERRRDGSDRCAHSRPRGADGPRAERAPTTRTLARGVDIATGNHRRAHRVSRALSLRLIPEFCALGQTQPPEW